MNKDEFYKKIIELDYSKGYYETNSFERRDGFNKCKEIVLSYVSQLDIEGMSPDTFELFRKAMNDLTNLYREMFQLQNELQVANRTIIDLQNQLKQKGE